MGIQGLGLLNQEKTAVRWRCLVGSASNSKVRIEPDNGESPKWKECARSR